MESGEMSDIEMGEDGEEDLAEMPDDVMSDVEADPPEPEGEGIEIVSRQRALPPTLNELRALIDNIIQQMDSPAPNFRRVTELLIEAIRTRPERWTYDFDTEKVHEHLRHLMSQSASGTLVVEDFFDALARGRKSAIADRMRDIEEGRGKRRPNETDLMEFGRINDEEKTWSAQMRMTLRAQHVRPHADGGWQTPEVSITLHQCLGGNRLCYTMPAQPWGGRLMDYARALMGRDSDAAQETIENLGGPLLRWLEVQSAYHDLVRFQPVDTPPGRPAFLLDVHPQLRETLRASDPYQEEPRYLILTLARDFAADGNPTNLPPDSYSRIRYGQRSMPQMADLLRQGPRQDDCRRRHCRKSRTGLHRRPRSKKVRVRDGVRQSMRSGQPSARPGFYSLQGGCKSALCPPKTLLGRVCGRPRPHQGAQGAIRCHYWGLEHALPAR